MTITFIGHGYVGLVTACVFADFGNNVYVIGHTKEKIERLKAGDPIIYEPGLREMLEKNLKAKRLRFVLDYKEAIAASDIVFITVGTPPSTTGEADLTAVFNVAKKIAPHLKKGFTIVSCKSTVPVGTNIKIKEIIDKNKPSSSLFAVASCPEFLREGTAINDTINSDRIVIGSNSKEAIDLLLKLHYPIGGKRVITDLSSAELIKYTSNAMLATKISFANLISFYCEKTGANVETVLDAVGLDRRIGRIFMDPGIGYGGSCLPKDVKALINVGDNFSIDTTFLESLDHINKQSQENLLKKIVTHVKEKKIGIWGLSFKPNTDDIRFAPSLFIIEELLKEGFQINAYDPVAIDNVKKYLGNKITFSTNPYDAVKQASALIICTEWNEFKQIDLNTVKKIMKTPVIFDGRNIYSPEVLKKIGFTYFSTGRQTV